VTNPYPGTETPLLGWLSNEAERAIMSRLKAVRFGVVIGAPFYPWYYPPYYYYPPYPVAVPAAPTTYIEQGAAPSERKSYWYYCEASKTYYPYVKECPGGWLRVVPQTAPQATPHGVPQETPQAAPG
jgi:hypothetical protein